MNIYKLGANTGNVMSNNPHARDDPRALAWRDLLPRWISAQRARDIIELNGNPLLAADAIGRSDLTELSEIRDSVRAEWDLVLHLISLIHSDVEQYWIQK